MTSRVLSTFFFISLVSLVAAVAPSHYQSLQQVANRTEDVQFSALDPASPSSRQKRQASSFTSTLKWVTMRTGDRLPRGAVYIYNHYVKRYDYVCKCGCEAGFYGRGQVCRYPYGKKEIACYRFQVLVNKDNFDILTWKDSSYGKVPPNSVRTCPTRDLYVGQNKYGLGKVEVSQRCFYLPWKGKEYWYRYYKVLTYDNRISREHISHVRYNIWAAKRTTYPETLIRSTVVNYQNSPIIKTFKLSKRLMEEKRWDTTNGITIGNPANINARIPFITLTGLRFSAVIRKQLYDGAIKMRKTVSLNVKARIPPHHACVVSLTGHKYKLKIPFTARLSRTYQNGITRRTSISGMYRGVNVIDFRSVVSRCVRVSAGKKLE